MNKPLVSVIMPTFNTKESYLREAIESIIFQTYENIEIIIIDDGSVGRDGEIVLSYNDSRIKYYKNDKNRGLPYTLNRAISLSNGEYILRMDSDDISMPRRIEVMVNFMEKHTSIDIVGTGKLNFGANTKKNFMPKTNSEIRSTLFFQSPFIHPSVMFRKTSVQKYNISYFDDENAEDYNLWFNCAKNHELTFANINKYLIKYRVHSEQITQKNNKVNKSTESIIREIFRYYEIEIDEKELELYCKFALGQYELEYNQLLIIDNILNRIIGRLKDDPNIESKILIQTFGKKYAKECIRQFITFKNLSGVSFYRTLIKEKANLPIKYRIVLNYIKAKSILTFR